jgi:hypothetical protein
MATIRIHRWVSTAAVGLLLAGPPWMAQAAQQGGEEEWLAAADSQLETMRGGFSVGDGVMVSFGIVRTVRINDMLASSSGFQVGELRSMSAAQAEQLAKQTTSLSLVQSGAGNTFASGLAPGSPAIVIQNTLNDQRIQSLTQIDAVSNGMSILKGINLNQALSDALNASLPR